MKKKTKIANFNKNLQHFNLSRVTWEPLYLSLFEAEIVTKCLTPVEKKLFTEQILSINQSVMSFNINIVDDMIQPLEILSKLAGETFDIKVKLHDKSGKILGIMTYNDVVIEEDTPIFAMNTDFSYASTECALTLDSWIKAGDVFFQGHNNKIKIHKSLK